ncbi:hypothetical protein WKV53_14195 [Luteolibacter sp. Y139]|uniref:DUF3592 domain-containing protein n=1 Tax=Luteolibacter soli TaxID=3135280 RepID=A0ABU9AXF0_9BACT
MMRAFYKSRLLWCGVPGLVFLVWAWWDSGRNADEVSWRQGRHSHIVMVTSGAVWWQDTRDEESNSVAELVYVGRVAMVDRARGTVRERGFEFPEAYSWTCEVTPFGEGEEVRTCELWVALWLMVLGYVGVWLGVVFAWRWRKRRVMRRLTDFAKGTEVVG